MSRGTSATHPNHPTLNGGNARISKTLDRRDAKKGKKKWEMETRNVFIPPLKDYLQA
jgi:hypothetical protein